MFKKMSDILDKESFPTRKQSQYNGKQGSRPKGSEVFDFLTLISRWEEVVGKKLAQVTIPLKNQNQALTILTNHSAYSQQLSLMEETLKSKIITVIPELQGKIKRLYFLVSTTHFETQKRDLLARASVDETQKAEVKKQTVLHPHNPKYKALRQEALNEFSDFEGELLEQMVSLYIQNKLSE